VKKVSLSLICAGLLTFASADFLSLSAGVGYSQQKIDGYVKKDDIINYFNNESAQTNGNEKTGDLGLGDKNNPYFWLKLIHPIPILPNIKFQYTRYHSTGHSKWLAGNVEIFGDVKIPAGLTNVNSQLDIDSYDITLFYEFQPVFFDLETGLGVDFWIGNVKVDGDNAQMINGNIVKTGGTTHIDEDWKIALPYLYANIETMKFFGFSALGYVKWAKAGDNHHYEYLGAIKYTFDIIGPINPFIKIGYKYKEVYGVDGDDETKLEYKGIFAEIGAKF
jgi:outer membrane protein